MSRSDVVEPREIRLGFQTVRAGEQRSLSWRKRQMVAAYARPNGFRLGQMLVHEQARGRPGALGASMRALLERGAGVRVVVVGR